MNYDYCADFIVAVSPVPYTKYPTLCNIILCLESFAKLNLCNLKGFEMRLQCLSVSIILCHELIAHFLNSQSFCLNTFFFKSLQIILNSQFPIVG